VDEKEAETPTKTSHRGSNPAGKWGDITPRWRADAVLGLGSTFAFKKMAGEDTRESDSGIELRLRADRRLGQSHVFVGAAWSYQRRDTREIETSSFSSYPEVHRTILQVRGVYRPIDGIDVYAQLGPSLNFSNFDPQYNHLAVPTVAVKEHQTRLGGEAQLGFSLYLPRAWLSLKRPSHLTFGLDVNGGVALGPNYAIVVKGSDESVNPIEPLNLGTYKTGGYTFNVGIFLRLM
jgi:hypothetical protein